MVCGAVWMAPAVCGAVAVSKKLAVLCGSKMFNTDEPTITFAHAYGTQCCKPFLTFQVLEMDAGANVLSFLIMRSEMGNR